MPFKLAFLWAPLPTRGPRNERSMKVAFVVDRFPSLSETFILDQMTGLIKRGHQVDVYARHRAHEGKSHADVASYNLLARTSYFGPPNGWVDRITGAMKLVARDLFTHPRRVAGALSPAKGVREALSLKTVYAANCFAEAGGDYDILHCHFGPNGTLGIRIQELLDLSSPVVTSFYGYDVSQAHWTRKNGPYKHLFSDGDLFVAISDDMIAKLCGLGCPADRIVKLPLGVNLREFAFRSRSGPANGTTFLTVARLVDKKGIEFAIRAVAKVSERVPAVRYRIVGDGPLRVPLQQLAKQLGVSEQVTFLGWQDRNEVDDLLSSADIFVLPSVTGDDGDQEGTPTVLLEAQAVGLPVVATKHAGIPEIVRDGHSGFLVPERDVGALAERLEFLIAHPETWSELGQAGREAVADHHDMEKLSGSLEEIYTRLVRREDLAPTWRPVEN